jgi:hypothetical protein
LTAGKDPRDVNTRPHPTLNFATFFGLAQREALPDQRTKKDPEICGCVRAAVTPDMQAGMLQASSTIRLSRHMSYRGNVN